MLKAPVPSITEVLQHCAQLVLGWVTAYKRVNHTKDWLALLTNKQTSTEVAGPLPTFFKT
jgi:hypothetical protein